ncbi:putative chromosome-partitioning protein ParB [Holospora obtusa F1]|uniref:Chromosome-partitioning protein ParB n=1 Tax=Holospora obtusa F1 TaxID=1399147 RepID=W6TEH8_HOLOB|nr:ParB/RepB/Spo0J family partition protein [Holospora obtusa]ETZ07668.1 putative chromosome-partitioning protein ParB [Holospora obtusa F1]
MKKSQHRQALGRGLSALLGEQGGGGENNLTAFLQEEHVESEKECLVSVLQEDQTLTWLDPKVLQKNPKQPRIVFDEVSLDELGHSIRSKGILQPLLVRRCGENQYEIIAGERRWRAAQLAGIEKIPCRVLEARDEEMMEIALLENIQRDDLNPIEEARGYQNLMDLFQYTQEKLAHRIGKSRSHIANMLRVLHLPESVQNLILDKHLSLGHAKVILSSKNPSELAQKVVENSWTVRQTEQAIKQEQALEKSNRFFEKALENSTQPLCEHLRHLEKNDLVLLETRLQSWIRKSHVKIHHKGAFLEVQLKFENLEDMERFVNVVEKKFEEN